jgi:hypothetical protein
LKLNTKRRTLFGKTGVYLCQFGMPFITLLHSLQPNKQQKRIHQSLQ